MSEKFKNKYRIKSARAPWWDYSNAAPYFVTICTKNKKHFFGEIADEKVHLSELGKTAEREWILTPSIRPAMNLVLDEFVVMPNHFHAIIIIGENEFNAPAARIARRDAKPDVSTRNTGDDTAGYVDEYIGPINKFGPQSNNLSSIMRGFKSAVTMFARLNNIEFNWQERFHDAIIRDDASFERIKQYIISNPKNWDKDRFRN